MRWLRKLVLGLLTIIAVLLTVWAAAALFFDSPYPALRPVLAIVYLLVIFGAEHVLPGTPTEATSAAP